MLRILLAFAVVGIIFIMSPERDSRAVLPPALTGGPSSWPPVIVKIEPRPADLAAAGDVLEASAQHLGVRQIAIPSLPGPIETTPLRR